ncbi:Major phosphate-irrepressible acid phosphatase [Fundidesulfovibrio magnetotacticus]|uniref:Major phosphate-irrepressible acid phosphatase n=1 Tax=Fundidesulfovibrio magnetotacticus TaxID=2730080 RepID=A0A6V8LNN6_9BACT|nr:phosphatase PAP2 family protein [Fundidesulfovibrio magnetotacticus]GFK92610.1 Major phosphate-irrepressible acid phosphatase [Fundidesulfovibrio magnetotacticus]
MFQKRLLVCFVSLVLLAGLALASDGPTYLPPGQPDLIRLLPPPPSAVQSVAEINELLTLQHSRTQDQAAFAREDAERSPLRFADVLGAGFRKDALPLTLTLFKHVLKDSNTVLDAAKKHWDRPRPFKLSESLRPCLDRPVSASYPSGHSTYGHLAAILLSWAVPEKAPELFARGDLFARQRLVGGVHYPSDVEAGKLCAVAIAQVMSQNPRFREEFAKARIEIRTALGLP